MSEETRREPLAEIRRKGLLIPPGAYRDVNREAPSGDVRAWPWWAAIWDRPWRHCGIESEWELERAREPWDRDRTFVEGQLEAAAELHHRRETEEASFRQAAEEAARGRLVDDLRARYLRTPGATAEEFEADLPDLLREAARKAALEADELPPALRDRFKTRGATMQLCRCPCGQRTPDAVARPPGRLPQE